MSYVKYPNLAEQGQRNLGLAESRMGALVELREEFGLRRPFNNLTIGMALHVTKETGVLVRALRAGGADVYITGCNPESTQDDVAAALAAEGVNIWAYKGQTLEEYNAYLRKVAESSPDISIDDGCDLVALLHRDFPQHVGRMIGGCEETTTGVTRLRNMEADGELHMPVIAINDNRTKGLLDNRYGTGQSTMDAIMRASNPLIAGTNVVVVGYGECGKGVADRAKGMSANVTVTEVDPFRALQAHYDGFRVVTMDEAAKYGDIFVTVTGNKHVIRPEHMRAMKDGVTLANAGHFDLEIDMEGLEEMASEIVTIRPHFDSYQLPDGPAIRVIGHGRLANLVAAEGHPSEVMTTSFLGQALACEFLVDPDMRTRYGGGRELNNGVITLPSSLDDEIAQRQLDDLGVQIDEITPGQRAYMDSWEEGT